MFNNCVSILLVLLADQRESYMFQMKMRRNLSPQPVAAVGPKLLPVAREAVVAHTYTYGSSSRSCCPHHSSMAPVFAGWIAARAFSR